MNPDLTSLQSKAQESASAASNMAASAPQLLESLRSNLTNIFAKDNPLIKEREQSLSTFLSTPDTTRASLLPGNLPSVEGSQLNLSPTQQNAIVSSRRSAAFAPLASLNNIITVIYGNIPSLVQNAGNIYGSAIEGARNTADATRQSYQDALQLAQFEESIRQFNEQEKRLSASSGDNGLSEAIMAILGGRNGLGGAQQGGGYDEAALDAILFGEEEQPWVDPLLNQGGAGIDLPPDLFSGLNLNLGQSPSGGLTNPGARNGFSNLGGLNIQF